MIIGLCGPISSGKTTAARFLIEKHGFWRHRMAAPLKAMLRELGLTDEELDGKDKEKPCELLGGKTSRWAQQSLGTEWGRDTIDPDLWVRAWKISAGRLENDNLVVDDIRFPNEVAMIKELGGVVVRIERPTVKRTKHISENMELQVDRVIINDGTLDELRARIEALI